VKYKAQVRYKSFNVHLNDLEFVRATISEGKEFHNLTVDINHE